MKTNYNLILDKGLYEKADQYAVSHGIELNELMKRFVEYLASKEEAHEASRAGMNSFVDDLHRDFEDAIHPDAKRDYRRYLIEKYR